MQTCDSLTGPSMSHGTHVTVKACGLSNKLTYMYFEILLNWPYSIRYMMYNFFLYHLYSEMYSKFNLPISSYSLSSPSFFSLKLSVNIIKFVSGNVNFMFGLIIRPLTH